jgi:adenylyltransferase/sulfurtransferase
MVEELSVEQLKARLDAGEQPRIIDVREDWELQISKLDIAQHLPMGQIPERVGELDPQVPLIIMCRSGGRSRQVAEWLVGRGFRSVSNLTGGILAWGERIDPSMRPY